jgi:hypothetical protein
VFVRKTFGALVVAFVGFCTFPASVNAQTDAAFAAFASLVKRIDNLSIYRMTPVPKLESFSGATTDPDLKSGVGFELLLLVKEWGAEPPGKSDALGKLTEIQITKGDTVRKYTPGAGQQPDHPWSLELGFAYNDQPLVLTGPDYEIRGSLRDQPGISLYLSRAFGVVAPYAGLRFSSYNLVGARAYVEPKTTDTTMRVISVSANGYALGFVAGAAISGLGLSAFAETEFARRGFESLQWPDNSPKNFPRGLKVKSPSLWIGVSIDLGQIFRS